VRLAKQGGLGFWQFALLMDICLLCKECAAAVPIDAMQSTGAEVLEHVAAHGIRQEIEVWSK
jgi:hypothetical protein